MPPDESAGNCLTALFSLLANKKKNNSNQSILQQAIDDIGDGLKLTTPVIPLSAATTVLSLHFGGIKVSNLGSGILSMGFVPPGVASPKSKATSMAIVKAIQSADDALGSGVVQGRGQRLHT